MNSNKVFFFQTDSQSDDYYEHIQKTEKHLPSKRRTLVQSRVRDKKSRSLKIMHRMAVIKEIERSLGKTFVIPSVNITFR